MMNKIKLIALCGKAGSGKDTIMHEAIRFNPSLHEVISCTTRLPREGEVEGKNYYFLSEKEFMNKVQNGEMLEWTNFNNWFYGTPLFALDPNKVNIGVFNPAGIIFMQNRKEIDLTTYLIESTDKQRLLRQLKREHDPNVKEIIRRFGTDEIDFKNLDSVIKYTELRNIYPDDVQRCTRLITGQNC